MRVTLAELAEIVQGEVVGDGALVIHGLSSLEQAQPGELTFVAERKYAPLLAASRASAVLVDGEQEVDRAAIRASNPSVAFFTLLDHFFPPQYPDWGIDERAVIASEAQVGQHVRIGPYVVIGRGARLGNRVIVYPGTYIG
ncbi:MAG: UDP-3-O-(3-hydroxymyristoyl)glucosamine N-acyltransferase, partial [Candidatus Tectomicrobia bacterium]|nr:UDP-3-O-(3-hydroxymyristoyl)glucosamine N-acyltransferase [Candidatus Tectomicrobia bacterium]